MKVAAYVPIKLNNERTPGKNTKLFDDGRALCTFMFNTIANVKGIDEAYCFCSDERIKEYLPDGVNFLKRSDSLDTSATQCHEIIRAFLNEVDADIVVLCHATCPFIKVESIEKCIKMVKTGDYDSAFTVSQIRDFLWKDGEPLNFNPGFAVKTQDLPEVYKESIGCYVFTKEMFMSSNRKVGFKPYLCPIDAYEEVDIDYPEDFEIANAIYMRILKSDIDKNGYR